MTRVHLPVKSNDVLTDGAPYTVATSTATGNAAALKLMGYWHLTDLPVLYNNLCDDQQTVVSTPIIPSPLSEMRRQRISTFHVAQRHHRDNCTTCHR